MRYELGGVVAKVGYRRLIALVAVVGLGLAFPAFSQDKEKAKDKDTAKETPKPAVPSGTSGAINDAEVIAFITGSGGPQQFSLLERCANESQSSLAAGRMRGAAPGAWGRPWANTSRSGPVPR